MSSTEIDTKLEVVIIPVADVDRAKKFYGGLGWRLDADLALEPDLRVVQVTPPGSQCSVIFGTGVTTARPGSAQGLVLVVGDLDAARSELARRGAAVSEPFHDGFHPSPTGQRLAGPDPARESYRSFASFSDPDGNDWLLQEITTRLPGRLDAGAGAFTDVAALSALLRETEQRHGKYEPTAPKHHWSEWYAAYLVARGRGRSPDEAAATATRHVERPKS